MLEPFESDPTASPAQDGGGCVPVDDTGAVAEQVGWQDVTPLQEGRGCGAKVLDSAIDIVAVHSVNSPGLVESWVGTFPSQSTDSCGPTPPSGTFLYTAGAAEQLTIFDASIHANPGDSGFIGADFINKSDSQFGSGQISAYLLSSAPPSWVPCAPNGAIVGLDGPWNLGPGQETMTCARLTLKNPHDAWLVRVSNGPNVLESVLSFGAPTGPDGTADCDETADANVALAIVKGAATVEAKPRDAHLEAGQQVVLRVHAGNTTMDPQQGVVSARIF